MIQKVVHRLLVQNYFENCNWSATRRVGKWRDFGQFDITTTSKDVVREWVLVAGQSPLRMSSDLDDELDAAVSQVWAIGPLVGSRCIGNENRNGSSPQRVRESHLWLTVASQSVSCNLALGLIFLNFILVVSSVGSHLLAHVARPRMAQFVPSFLSNLPQYLARCWPRTVKRKIIQVFCSVFATIQTMRWGRLGWHEEKRRLCLTWRKKGRHSLITQFLEIQSQGRSFRHAIVITIPGSLSHAGHCPGGCTYLLILFHLIFMPSRESRYPRHHFADEGDEESERLCNLHEVTQLRRGGCLSDFRAGVLFLFPSLLSDGIYC